MKSNLPTLKEYRATLKKCSKSKLINICVECLRRDKEREHSLNVDIANEIAKNVNLPVEVGGITPKQALKQIKELGFSLKEIKELFPKHLNRGLWEKEELK